MNEIEGAVSTELQHCKQADVLPSVTKAKNSKRGLLQQKLRRSFFSSFSVCRPRRSFFSVCCSLSDGMPMAALPRLTTAVHDAETRMVYTRYRFSRADKEARSGISSICTTLRSRMALELCILLRYEHLRHISMPHHGSSAGSYCCVSEPQLLRTWAGGEPVYPVLRAVLRVGNHALLSSLHI
jgi:hypothetical protein